jgi:hypothetical protein
MGKDLAVMDGVGRLDHVGAASLLAPQKLYV